MQLETFFNEEDIQEIYDEVIIYSILKYQTLTSEWQGEFYEKYCHAIQLKEQRAIPDILVHHNSLEHLNQKLTNYQTLYNTILQLNESIIDQIGPQIMEFIVKTIDQEETEYKKVNLLFDFLTTYLTYSEEYYQHCLQVPPVDGFTFDFKNNIPVDCSINGLLVIGQGVCDDFSNLLMMLGKKLKLNISKVICEYQGELHALNMITFQDGTNSLIDTTRKIRQDKSKEECFLVSQEKLNKDKNYTFPQTIPQTITFSQLNLSNEEKVRQLIELINEIKPPVQDLNKEKTR